MILLNLPTLQDRTKYFDRCIFYKVLTWILNGLIGYSLLLGMIGFHALQHSFSFFVWNIIGFYSPISEFSRQAQSTKMDIFCNGLLLYIYSHAYHYGTSSIGQFPICTGGCRLHTKAFEVNLSSKSNCF